MIIVFGNRWLCNGTPVGYGRGACSALSSLTLTPIREHYAHFSRAYGSYGACDPNCGVPVRDSFVLFLFFFPVGAERDSVLP